MSTSWDRTENRWWKGRRRQILALDRKWSKRWKMRCSEGKILSQEVDHPKKINRCFDFNDIKNSSADRQTLFLTAQEKSSQNSSKTWHSCPRRHINNNVLWTGITNADEGYSMVKDLNQNLYCTIKFVFGRFSYSLTQFST